MYLIAGLGNPGSAYAETKHNVGFMVIDTLSKEYNISMKKLKHRAFVGDGEIKGERVLLAKPQTYMNLSGESIKEILGYYKIPEENFIVIFDDASLELGTVRIRAAGSDGGHNGVRNIINHLGNDDFKRVKVGIGDKAGGEEMADHVLSAFNKDEKPVISSSIEKAALAVELMLAEGIENAMNKINPKIKK